MTHAIDAIPEQALAWAKAGKKAALATVIQTWGSAPRSAGAQLAISGDAELVGSVSGGCVEAAVTAEALDAMRDGAPRLLSFGVSDDDAFAVGLACGGEIRVLVEPIGPRPALSLDLLRDLVAARAARRVVGVLTDIESWDRALMSPDAAADAFRLDRAGFIEDSETKFLALHNPPLRLVIVGAAHIAQALAPMARLSGYDVLVVDPRGAFAAERRFPDERLSQDWPDAALAAHGLDARTAVACLTHDPKIDDPALILALPSPAFYVGALGSMRTHAKRVERLRAAGLASAMIERLHAPIGLDIGARSPAEIAVAALAEITAALRGKGAGA